MNQSRWIKGRYIPFGLLVLIFIVAVTLDLHRFLSFDSLKSHHTFLKNIIALHLTEAALLFVIMYSLITAASIPGATFMTLAGGLYFGLYWGAALSVCGATLGATLVFLAAKTAFADFFYQRVKEKLPKLAKGFQQNAFTYLLFLRLVPIFPFFIVNIAPAFLNMDVRPYVIATFFGIIPGGLVYASLGSGLETVFASGQVPSLSLFSKKEIVLPLFGLGGLSLLPLLFNKRT